MGKKGKDDKNQGGDKAAGKQPATRGVVAKIKRAADKVAKAISPPAKKAKVIEKEPELSTSDDPSTARQPYGEGTEAQSVERPQEDTGAPDSQAQAREAQMIKNDDDNQRCFPTQFHNDGYMH